MKILYVKNNSERAKAFQLKTIIYEANGQKYIKKKAITSEAIPHLKKMKENYTKLSHAIIDSKVKVTPIIDESEDSLTFEFIEGESLEKKFNKASQSKRTELLNEYISLVNNAFRTTTYQDSFSENPLYNTLLGEQDFSLLSKEKCFDGISNIDLIFSNIIYKDEEIYLIDYEWAYEVNLPVEYIIQRTLSMLSHTYNFETTVPQNALLYQKMERHFVDIYVMENGFYFQKNQYMKKNTLITKQIEQLKSHIKGKEDHIQELASKMHTIGEELSYARSVVELRDKQVEFLSVTAQSLRLKSRIKQMIKSMIPSSILESYGYNKNPLKNLGTFPETIEDIKPSIQYIYNTPQHSDSIQNALKNFDTKPLISIVMPVYNVDQKWLRLAIESIENQWYDNWELCIADDKSSNIDTVNYLKSLTNPKIKITFLEKNLNISGATNAAIGIATGEYIALMDNDDEITPDALYEMVKVINEEDAEFIYSDEDFISTEGIHSNPHYKPDFSPDLLLSHNYITHFTCFKKELLDKVGLYHSQFDGAQDYDLFLRLTEQTSKIEHISKVLYHWRMLETSTSANSEAKPEAIGRGKAVLEAALKRRAIDATVEHGNMHHYFRVKYTIKDNPLVSIIIPFKDKPELLDMSINSILDKSTYQNFEIIGISNNSEEQETFTMMSALEKKDSRIKFYEYNTEFNYADINNYAINTYAKGEHVLLLNNDIEVITPTWIEAMLEHSQREEVGCVGAKLYYPDDTVQHAGIIIGLGGYAGHSHKMYPRESPGYFNRLNTVQDLSAVTAACLMIKKSIYQEIGGMDAQNFKVAYNDVDFCLRVREQNYLNIFTPYPEMYHHESISRGYETTPEKIERFQLEKDALSKRHKNILTEGDPYYNPNLCHDKEDFSLCPK